MSTQLNDPIIRERLKAYLHTLPVKPRAILEELHVHKGNAIADIVAVYKEPHCFEIKGETDNISRILTQGKYYDLVFKKITLVTTNNHLKKALKMAPSHWGVIVVFLDNDLVKLKHIRKTSANPKFCKKLALLTLWKEEMLRVGSINEIDLPKRINKLEIVSELANHLTINKISSEIANSLLERTETINSHST